jgi:hypothetical protein
MSEEKRFDSWQEKQIYIFPKAFRPAMGPNSISIDGYISGGKAGQA